MLDRIGGDPPVMQYLADSLEELGYSWAHRTINTAGTPSILLQHCPAAMPCCAGAMSCNGAPAHV